MPAETDSDSDSATGEAASASGSRRTTANAERDQTFNRNNQDIGVDEAYQLAGLNATRSWDANVKRTYDVLEEELHTAVKASQANIAEHHSHIAELHTVRIQMLSNMAVNCDSLQKQHTAHRDIATDATWTKSNEMETMMATAFASANAKTGVQSDAFIALLAEAVAKRMGGT